MVRTFQPKMLEWFVDVDAHRRQVLTKGNQRYKIVQGVLICIHLKYLSD